jgi:hypothetical protein
MISGYSQSKALGVVPERRRKNARCTRLQPRKAVATVSLADTVFSFATVTIALQFGGFCLPL